MDENNVKVNSVKAWLLAARPKTLAGAAVPVMIGVAMAVACHGDGVRWVPAVLCVLFAFVMQVDANFVNDYFDFMKGTDDETRLGPKRACAQGWITAPAMRRGLLLTTVVACAIGLPLVCYGGWEMILVGLACVVFCFLYTISFSYIGLGDVLVLVFFGLVPVSLTYWLSAPESPLTTLPLAVVGLSLTCGLVIDTLLVVNNYRDIDNDRRAGKRTLIVRIGARAGRRLYLWLGIVACVGNILIVGSGLACGGSSLMCGSGLPMCGSGALVCGGCSLSALLLLLYLPFHVAAYRDMVRIDKGAALNSVLGKTARNMFVFGLLTSLALILA